MTDCSVNVRWTRTRFGFRLIALAACLAFFAGLLGTPDMAFADKIAIQAHSSRLRALRPDIEAKLNRKLHKINRGPGTKAQKQKKMRQRFDKAIRQAERDITAARKFGNNVQYNRALSVLDVLKSYKSAFFGGPTTDRSVKEREDELRKAAADKKKKEAGKKTATAGGTPTGYSAPAWPISLALDFGGSRGSYDGSLVSSFGSDVRDGSKDSVHSIGIDARIPLAGLGPNVDIVAGGWARAFVGGDMRVSEFDLHPTAGKDTFLSVEEQAFALTYLGLRYKFEHDLGLDPDAADACAAYVACGAIFTVFAGPRLQFNKVTLVTDESGGGGVRNTFKKNQTKVGVTVGVDVEVPLGGRRPGMPGPFIRFGAAADYTPSQKVSGMSTLGFDYDSKIKSDVAGRIFFGIGLNLD